MGVLILTTAFLVFFGFPYVIILTAIIKARLGVPDADVSRLYSIVYAFNGGGALVGALGIAGLRPTIKRERLIPLALLAFSLSIIAFSFAPTVPIMCAITLFAGAVYISTSSLVMTSIQSAVPGHLRGRVMALFMMAFMGVMPLSAFAFGPLGQAIGPDNAVLAGGVVLLAWAARSCCGHRGCGWRLPPRTPDRSTSWTLSPHDRIGLQQDSDACPHIDRRCLAWNRFGSEGPASRPRARALAPCLSSG